MKAVRGLLFLLAPVAVIAIIIAVTGGEDAPTRSYSEPPKMTIDTNKSYTATIETDLGNIVAELDPKTAPNAVNSFVFLARQRFYDDLCFDRQAKGWLIQGGSPTCDGIGGSGFQVTDTPGTDGYPVGSLVGASFKGSPPGMFSSPFFIVTGTASPVDGKNIKFGTVISGLEVAQKISERPVKPGTTNKPRQPVRIKRITIKVGGVSTTAPSSSTTPSSAPASSSTTSPPASSTTEP